MNKTKKFYNLVKARSIENLAAFQIEYNAGLYGKCVSTLREELDSYIKIIFLRKHPGKDMFIDQTLSGKQWKFGSQKITDRFMLDYLKDSTIDEMDYWEREYIYRMGCFFIHLSNFHSYKSDNPFNAIAELDKINIIRFIKSKHGYEMDTSNLDINKLETIIPFLPLIMNKINSNLLYQLEALS